ncbi:hypothetical protein J6590_107132, partial [Homalodisca vitripennis]
AKDVAEILEFKNTRQAIIDHVKEKYKKSFENIDSDKGIESRLLQKLHPDTIFINEPGIYSLILKSKMKIAETFQNWVLEEVLPSIRKYGEYKLENENKQLKDEIKQLQIKDEMKSLKIENQELRMELMKRDM